MGAEKGGREWANPWVQPGSGAGAGLTLS